MSVAVNYRLGGLGFFHLKQAETEGQEYKFEISHHIDELRAISAPDLVQSVPIMACVGLILICISENSVRS